MKARNDHILITVGKHTIGITGLKRAIEELSQSPRKRTDEEISRELLQRIALKNYVPSSAEDDYKRALLREFKKHLGIPVEETSENLLRIKVFGPGCSNCELLVQRVYEVLGEMGKEADVEHVTDIKAIAAAGVMGTPAVMINGTLKASGIVPTKSRIKEWISGVEILRK